MTNPFYKENGKIVARPLKGGEKRRVFSKTSLLFKEFNRVETVKKKDKDGNEIEEEIRGPLFVNDQVMAEKIWSQFDDIFFKIKDQKYPEDTRIETIKKNCFDWLNLYERRYGADKITVYMHIFGEHLWQLVKLHGDINLFSMQGLEKLNDLTKIAYFSSSNKQSGGLNSCEVQMINKRNRIDAIHGIEQMPGNIEKNFIKFVKFCREGLERDRV